MMCQAAVLAVSMNADPTTENNRHKHGKRALFQRFNAVDSKTETPDFLVGHAFLRAVKSEPDLQ